jgi:hypothetical protein
MTELRAIAFDLDGVELVGQMSVPERSGPHPAVMFMRAGTVALLEATIRRRESGPSSR